MKFVMISNSDGDTYVTQEEAKDFAALKRQYKKDNEKTLELVEDFSEMDTNYWPEGTVMVIKGDIVKE